MAIPVYRGAPKNWLDPSVLNLDAALVTDWLIKFLKHECIVRRNVSRAVIGLSGGLDSAVVAYLCAAAFGPENTHVVRMPYKISSQSSLDHAQLVIDDLGLPVQTLPITDMVDGYLNQLTGEVNGTRIGNVCSRCRANILFDQGSALGALPIGTGNKTERLFGYFTWHADDSPPINPLGDLLKTQVFQIAEFQGVPAEIVHKPPSADLIEGQTDEKDFGITYAEADLVLFYLTQGYTKERLLQAGFDPKHVEIVWKRVDSTHWKRHMPTIAMVSDSSINDYYLRPVDY